MDSILIISDEPALADTLQSELTDIAVAQARFREAAAKLGENRHRLVVLDETENAGAVPDVGKLPVLRLSRPVVLSELL
jgi:DNA-binding response OmpR family regulator